MPSENARPRASRGRRRTLAAALIVAVVAIAGWLMIRSSWTNERVRLALLSRINRALAGQLTVGHIDGSVLGRIGLHDVSLTSATGEPVLTADAIFVRYSPVRILRDGWTIDAVEIVRPVITLIQTNDGWNVTRLARATSSPGKTPDIGIRDLTIQGGEIHVRPLDAASRVIAEVDARASLSIADADVQIGVTQFDGIERTGGLQINRLTTVLTFRPDRIDVGETHLTTNAGSLTGHLIWPRGGQGAAAFGVDANRLEARLLRPYIAALASIPDTATLSASASGTSQDLSATWTMDSTDGRIAGDTHGSIDGTQVNLTGRVQAAHVEPRAWLASLRDLHTLDAAGTYAVSGSTRDASSWRASFDVAANRIRYGTYAATDVHARGEYRGHAVDTRVSARVYGAQVSGRVRADTATMHVDADGRFRGVNAVALPASLAAPAIHTNLNGTFAATVRRGQWRVSATFDPSMAAGALLAPGSRAAVQSDAGHLKYDAHLDVRDLDPPQLAPALPGAADTLAKWPGCVNAVIDLNAAGTSRETVEGTATIDVTDSTLPGAAIEHLHAEATVVHHRLTAIVDGDVTVDAAQFLPEQVPDARELTGPATVHASLDLPDLTQDVRLEDVIANATVQRAATGVERSPFELDASMVGGQITVTRLAASLPSFGGSASGTLAVAGAGSSDLTFEVSASDLSAFQRLFNRPVTGRASIAGHITGTANHNQVTGTWSTTALESTKAGIVSANGQFQAAVTDLDWNTAAVQTTVAGSLVRAGSIQFDTLSGDVSYDRTGGLRAHVTLADPARAIEIGGAVTPDDHGTSIAFDQFRIAAAGVTWQLAPGSGAGVRVTDDSLSVSGLALTDGAQGRIEIDGGLGPSAAVPELTVQAEAIAIATLAAWVPGLETMTGSLGATARVTGPLTQPDVTATAAIDGGAINGVPFQRIDLTGGYASHRISVDARVSTADGSALTAIGTLPGPGAGGDVPWDLRVDSAGIDVALLQPAVPAVENLRGQGTFQLHIAGAPAAIDGSLALSGVSFHVPATGVDYRNVTANLEASGHDLLVHRFQAEDAAGHVARVEGSVTVPGVGPPDRFNLRLTTDQLSVLDNTLGVVSVSGELQILGNLDTPLATGTVRVDRGRLEVDRWLAELRTAYAPVASDETPAGPGTPFSRSSLSITLDMPDNIVARGRDLRTNAEGPLGLGDINVTVGGALTIAKEVGEPLQIIGPMNVVRGDYRFQGRAFSIARGSTVMFHGDPSQPQFNIAADHTVSGVVATVHVTGTPQRPAIRLTSQPPLEEGDILSLIVFNQAMDRLPAEQRVSLAARAGALAAGAIATPISNSVARALDLDQFDIRPADTGRGASVVVGRQINDRLFVGFRQDFGQTEASQLTLELRINEYLRLVTSLAQGADVSEVRQRAETAGIDLFFVIR